ncbi:hypothetical protein [Streptomyces sp. WG-D5]
MTKLVGAVDVRPRVWHRTVQIGPLRFDEAPVGDAIVEIPGDGLTLNSSDNDFYPLVRLESWDAPAPVPDARCDWDYQRTFAASLTDEISVVELGGVVAGTLPVQPGGYVVRVLCWGRDHVEAFLALDPFPPEGPHDDPLEFWVIQAWPVARS